jgi:hypothetical protein
MVMLAGCGGDGVPEERPEDRQRAPPATPARPAVQDSQPTSGTLGPLRFRYDATELTLAEVLLELPPAYVEQSWSTKLMPVARAALLGQDRCQYASSARTEICDAEREPGLLLALLERPLSHYRDAFIQSGAEDALSPARLDGLDGFRFSDEQEGARTEYHFLPLRGRTLLVARRFVEGQDEGTAAMRDVIRSLERGAGGAVLKGALSPPPAPRS